MLSVSSSVYDPLGFLAPVLLPAKIMLQERCRRNFGWDETVPQELLYHWTRWLEELDKLSEFKINRCIKPKGFGNIMQAQFHHFSDASESGYGAPTPLKAVTIPRLELTAAVLAVRVDLMLSAELQIQKNQFI